MDNLYLTIRKGADPISARLVLATSDEHILAAAIKAVNEQLVFQPLPRFGRGDDLAEQELADKVTADDLEEDGEREEQ